MYMRLSRKPILASYLNNYTVYAIVRVSVSTSPLRRWRCPSVRLPLLCRLIRSSEAFDLFPFCMLLYLTHVVFRRHFFQHRTLGLTLLLQRQRRGWQISPTLVRPEVQARLLIEQALFAVPAIVGKLGKALRLAQSLHVCELFLHRGWIGPDMSEPLVPGSCWSRIQVSANCVQIFYMSQEEQGRRLREI
jgi:hypothetical protein